MESLLLGVLLGLFAGMVPGPFLTLVAATALQRGLEAGLRVALVPLLTDTPVLLASVFVLTQLSDDVLRWIGVAGGLLVLYMAWRVIRESRDVHLPDSEDEDESLRGHYLRIGLVGLLAPAPWVFWFLLGGPLLLNRWHVSPWHGLVFVVGFFGCFVGAMMLVALGVATGRRKLSRTWYRRALRTAGAVLAVAGGVLIWQSWVGNFSEMVQPQEQIRDVVEEASETFGPGGS